MNFKINFFFWFWLESVDIFYIRAGRFGCLKNRMGERIFKSIVNKFDK